MQFTGTDAKLLDVSMQQCVHCDLAWNPGPPAEAELTVWYGERQMRADEYASFKAALNDMRQRHSRGERIDCIELGDGRWFCGEASKIIVEAGWAMPLFYQSRKNARKRGIPFSMTRWDFLGIVARSNGHCELTGIPFDTSSGEWGRRPWMPSVDRADSAKGYTPENVRLVCYAANCAMNEWGESILDALALARAKRLAR